MMRRMMGNKNGPWTIDITHSYDRYTGYIYIALNGVDVGSLRGTEDGTTLSLTYKKGDIIRFYAKTWMNSAEVYIDGVSIGSTNYDNDNMIEFVTTKKHTMHLKMYSNNAN